MVEADDSERVRDDGAVACGVEWAGEGVYQYVLHCTPLIPLIFKVPETTNDVDEL